MSLTDFIRPKWKHSDPGVRREAVQQMDPNAAERLEKIAITDLDSGVRVEAIRKIADVHFLHEFAASKGDSAVIEAAQNRLNVLYREKILQSGDTGTRLAYLEKIEDEQTLADIARTLDDPAVRMAVADRLRNPDLLCTLTESNCGLRTGLAIVEKLTEPDHLERIAARATNKKVKREAARKIATLRKTPEAAAVEDVQGTKLDQLCQTLEKLLADGNWINAYARLSDLQAEWSALDPEHAHPLYERFAAAREQVEGRLQQLARENRVREELSELCAAAETVASDLPEDGASRLAYLQSQWEQSDGTALPGSVHAGLRTRFETACNEYERRRNARAEAAAARQKSLQMLDALAAEAEALSGKETGEADESRWTELKADWDAHHYDAPETAPLRDRFEAAYQSYQDRRREKEIRQDEACQAEADRLRQLLKTVTSVLETDTGDADPAARHEMAQTVKAAQAEWKQSGERAPAVKAELALQFEAACSRFFEKQREYWDNLEWERWANLNQKEELCRVIEVLADSGVLEGAGTIVRETQKKWREIGPISRDRVEDIQTRFNTACDQVYQRCLTERTRLCEELKTLLEPQLQARQAESSVPENFNWSETSGNVKEIQARWNTIGFLPQSMEKELRQTFQEMCNHFFEDLRSFYQSKDAERQENLQQKQALCAEAESLAASGDWGETANRLKAMQREWKEIGPVPRNDSDALWKRFRSACDRFFERLKQAEPENLARKNALCEKAEAIAASVNDDNDIEPAASTLMDLQREWKEIGPVPAEAADDIWKRFRETCDAFFARRSEYLDRRAGEQAEHQAQKEAMVEQAEALAGSTDWKETADRLKTLQQEWKEVGPAPHRTEQELWHRFRSACDRFFTRRNRHFEKLDQNREENLKEKEGLCLALEGLACLVIPEEKRRDYDIVPVAEHLSIGLDFKEEVVVPGDMQETWKRTMHKVRESQQKWKEIGPVPQSRDAALWKRFRSVVDMFYGSRPGYSPGDNRQPSGKEEESA